MRTQLRAALRASNSLSNKPTTIPRPGPQKWNRPLAVGVLPAYDEALKVIKSDSYKLKEEVSQLRTNIINYESTPDKDDKLLKSMQERLNVLEVQSEINLPEVRWTCANGMADMNKAVHRHLVEQRWRDEGALDLLMERIHQMNVVPDILPSLHPSIDLRITFPTPPPRNLELRENSKRRNKEVEPGVFLLPEQTRHEPSLYVSVFHPETRLYTLVMVDPDVPREANQGFQNFLHWLRPNIPLSAQGPQLVEVGEPHTPYIPPHPQRGTPYHRYVLLLLPQSPSDKPLKISPVTMRSDFDLRHFMEKHGLDSNFGGGAHMWREVWSEEVSKIYKDILNIEEPVYGRPKVADPYAEVKKIRRYV